MKMKYILKALYLLIVIQLLRVALKNICFLFLEPTMIANTCFNAIFMIFATIFIVRVMNKYNYNKSLKLDDLKSYTIIGIIIFLIGILSLLIGHHFSYENFVTLLYFMIVLPIFEEILFRGYLWDRANKIFKSNLLTLIVTTLLYAIWIFGYTDTLLLNSVITNVTFKFSTILWKVLISMGIGIATGLTRIKCKNCYSSSLLHSLISIFIR